MKKIIFSLATILAINSNVFAKDILNGTNYCKENLVSFMSDNYDYESQKKRNLQIFLNIESNKELAIKNLMVLEKKPYNEEAFISLVNIFKNDRNPNNFNSNQKSFDSLVKNQKHLETLFDSMIWLRTNEAKIAAIDLLNMVSIDAKLNRSIKQPSYRNYMSLKNIGFFKYQTEADSFLSKIDKVDKKDIIYKEFFELMEGNFNKNSIEEKDLKAREKNVIKSISICYSDKNISRFNSKFTPEVAFKLFIDSKLFPEHEDNLRSLYYAGSEKTNIWELMEYFYLIKQNNMDKASKLIELIYNLEDKPDYLKSIAIKTYYKTANDSLNYNKFYISWNNSLKALKLAEEIKNITNEDLNTIIELKKIFKNSATKLIDYYTSKHEAENANYVYNTTDIWLNKIYTKKTN